ncbi:hypothetical protein AA0312_2394 [Acetobacter tropicalis NRIC 0312]|nr:hypothetical protein AA0312_2394 [Acetobacter tropicalis NRIC 0312]
MPRRRFPCKSRKKAGQGVLYRKTISQREQILSVKRCGHSRFMALRAAHGNVCAPGRGRAARRKTLQTRTELLWFITQL